MTDTTQTDRFYAHSVDGQPPSAWEPLDRHLRNVAELAGCFAAAFDARDWGALAGLWHDLGKYKPEFQALLRGASVRVEHSGIGAALASSLGGSGLPLAFAIAGHHAGLANYRAQGDTEVRSLMERIEDNAPELLPLRATIPAHILNQALPAVPPYLKPSTGIERDGLRCRLDLWTRFLFSALVDADRLASEAFDEPRKRESLRDVDAIPVLRERLDSRLASFNADTEVNRIRAQVLQHCRSAAEASPGVFSLTVPTGGGKTLSSMAFALRHAERHGMRRVIVVIPYTSIIEQNAQEYAEKLDKKNVIEHHSNLDEAKRREVNQESELRRRLAAENWDAPIVVTTNVQFFESLFANHPSRCRKLHNIARSVVVFDEVQALPAGYLNCVLDAMRELVSVYGCSLLLMTATQPALRKRDALPFGFPEGAVREIMPDPRALARVMRRVEIQWPASPQPTPYTTVAQELCEHERVLAVVHLRKDARALAQLLPADNRLHLSALMCAAHRSAVLAEVKRRLEAGEPCRLVATQLVEAGVDIDFPVVYRTLAGLDSLAQAAGRCNREGTLVDERGEPRKGRYSIFRAETKPPPGILRLGLESTDALLQRYGGALDLTDPSTQEEYFRILYSKCETDAKGVQAERRQLNFATVAERVHLIEDGYTRPVVVPWREAAKRVSAFRARPNRTTQRALQPFLVEIREPDFVRLLGIGALENVDDSVHVLTQPYHHLYDAIFGLVIDGDVTPDPERLIA